MDKEIERIIREFDKVAEACKAFHEKLSKHGFSVEQADYSTGIYLQAVLDRQK